MQARLQEILTGEGFVLGEWGTHRAGLGTAMAEGHRDRLRVMVGVDARRAWRDGKPLTLAPGQVGVTAILETYHGD